jgi:hypothetical protein
MSLHWSRSTSASWQQQSQQVENFDWNPFSNITDASDITPTDQFHSNSTLYLLSIANVPNKQSIVWVHVALLYFISLSWLWLLFVNHWHHLYLLRTCPSTAKPTELITASQQKQRPPLVRITTATTITHNTENLQDNVTVDGESAPLSTHHSISSSTEATTEAAPITTASLQSLSSPSSSESSLSLIPASIHQRSILITNIPHPLRNTASLQHHFNVTQVGSVTSVTLVYRAASHALDCALKQRQQWVDRLEKRLIYRSRQIVKQQGSTNVTREMDWLDMPRKLQLHGLPTDDLLAWMHDIRLLDNEIKQLRDANLSPQYYKPTGTAFVTFE